MQTPKKRSLLLCLCVCLPCLTVQAYDLDKALSPSIDDQTFALAHLDVSKLDLDALIEKVLSMAHEHMGPDAAGQSQADLAQFRAQAGAQLESFLRAGGKEVFAVFSMYDFPYFTVVIPIPPGSDQDKLFQEVRRISQDFKVGDLVFQVSGPVIQVGPKQTVSRPRAASRERRKVLTAALQACGDTMAQVVFFPSADQRRILGEMLPPMAQDAGDGQWVTLSQDLEWAALGINGPPSLSANLTIQAASAEVADRVLTSIKALYAFIGQQVVAQEAVPELDEILRRLTPEKEGRYLRLRVNAQTMDSLIQDTLTPSLLQAREQARRIVCMNNLRQIGLGLFMYADDHNDKLPPDLNFSIIGKYLGSNPKILMCPATRREDPYVYRGATLTVGDTPWMITVHDKKGNHEGGRNVAFLDGHAEWVTEERFRKLIEKDNAYRRSKQMPVLPVQ